jgi:hypothetical protein
MTAKQILAGMRGRDTTLKEGRGVDAAAAGCPVEGRSRVGRGVDWWPRALIGAPLRDGRGRDAGRGSRARCGRDAGRQNVHHGCERL